MGYIGANLLVSRHFNHFLSKPIAPCDSLGSVFPTVVWVQVHQTLEPEQTRAPRKQAAKTIQKQPYFDFGVTFLVKKMMGNDGEMGLPLAKFI